MSEIKGAEPLLEEEQLKCLEAIRNGDESAREKLIMSYINLAHYLAYRFAHRYRLGYYYDELESVAIASLVESVSKIENITHDNIGGYILTRMKGAILDAMASQPIIKTPRGKRPAKFQPLPKGVSGKQKGGSNEALEAVLQICRSNTEKEIVKSRLAGKTDEQIAAQLSLSRLQVHRTRKSLQKRYREKYDE